MYQYVKTNHDRYLNVFRMSYSKSDWISTACWQLRYVLAHYLQSIAFPESFFLPTESFPQGFFEACVCKLIIIRMKQNGCKGFLY